MFYAILTVTLVVPVLGGLYVRRAGPREGLASVFVGVSVLVVTHYLSHGEGYGVLSPALAGVVAARYLFFVSVVPLNMALTFVRRVHA